MAEFRLSQTEKNTADTIIKQIESLYNDIGPIEYIIIQTPICKVVKISFPKYKIVRDITDYNLC